MLTIVIGSKNPVKVNAVKQGFQKMFLKEQLAFESISTESQVDEQPKSDAETFQGAWNRSLNASKSFPKADYLIGIESGIDFVHDEMVAFSWVVIKSRDNKWGKGRTSTFFLPPPVVALVKQGKELGEADNIVFGRQNSAQEDGAIGLLSGNMITRTSYLIEAVIIALIPFKNSGLYFS